MDLLSVIWNSTSNQVSLMASDDTHGLLYASNQCVVICPESMKFTLPPGTPLGNEGDPLWILPQNPYTGVPYVGVSAETVSAGVFNDPFTLTLTRLEGPGQFIVWQAGSFGSIDVKLDTRNGIGPSDYLTLPVGGHAHYNWGFTTSGVYRAYFQASGIRVGQSTNTVSPETPVHVPYPAAAAVRDLDRHQLAVRVRDQHHRHRSRPRRRRSSQPLGIRLRNRPAYRAAHQPASV